MKESILNKSDRDDRLDYIRGMAIIIVVIGHSIQANLMDGESCQFWSEFILYFQMPLLFLVSGYTMAYTYPCEQAGILRYLSGKAKRLLIPHIMWATLHYLLACILVSGYKSIGLFAIFNELFISDYWFLRILFLCFLVIWVINIIINCLKIDKSRYMLISMILMVIGTILLLLIKRIPFISHSVSVRYYLWFCLGYLNSKVRKALIEHKIICLRSPIFIIIPAGVFTIAIFYINNIQTINDMVLRVIYTVNMWVFLYISYDFLSISIRNYCIYLEKSTLLIYSIHWVFLFSILWRLDFYISVRGELPLWMATTITAICWLLICHLGIYFIRKFKILKILFAGEE